MREKCFALATHNDHKLSEFRAMLAKRGMEVSSMKELGFFDEIEENGDSFEENALIKARALCKLSGRAAIADDSGLEVEALGGAPGIYSARYGGDAAKNDKERTALLLENMRAVEDGKRAARFVSCIALVFPDGREYVVEGEVKGSITRDVCGENGFGYDPVFYVPEYSKTMGEMPAELKNEISHRACAFKKFCTLLEEI